MLRILVSGAIYNLLNIFTKVVLGLLVFKEMLLHFGVADFGLWSFLFAIFAHIKLFEFGMGSLISKLVPVLEKDRDNRSNFSTVFFAFIFVSLCFLILAFCVLLVPLDYGVEFQGEASLKVVIFLLALNFVFVFLTGPFRAFLTGNFKVGMLNAVGIFTTLLRSALILSLLEFEFGILAVAVSFTATAGLELLLLIFLASNIGLFEKIDFKLCSTTSLAYVTKRGRKLLFLSVNNYARNNAAIIYCGLIFGPVILVPLRIAGRLMEIYVEVSTALNYLLTPYFSSVLSSHVTSKSFNRKFLTSISCATALSCTIFCNLMLLSDWFLVIWLKEVPTHTLIVVQVLAIGFCIANCQSPCTSMLISKNQEKVLMKICLAEIFVLLLVLWPLIEMYSVIGGAYSVLLSLVFSRALLQPILVCRTLGFSLFRYGYSVLFPGVMVICIVLMLNEIINYFEIENQFVAALYLILSQGIFLLITASFFYIKGRNEKRSNNIRI